jgi:hypothetical protein
MKRRAFKTSPSVRIPRAAVERLQQTKEQAQAQAQEITCLKYDKAIYLVALHDLMAFFDKLQRSSGSWTVPEVKRIEEIRLLSIGV